LAAGGKAPRTDEIRVTAEAARDSVRMP
jgi:hypothetical protein